uniref:non-specific serine/threonine protein kinase n=1 Tax=Fagus sylvatica TaxID=28930 RepID=A0A2N9IAW5_FAGSY
MELVDPELGSEFSEEEALRMIKVALLCANASPALRPTMTAAVSMLEGLKVVHELTMDSSIYGNEWRLRFNPTTLSQEKLVWKDFNIEDDAGIAQKPVIKRISNISVSNNVLEIRFYWAGKGTTRIPDRGVYGPLISAVSVVFGELFM